MKLKTAKWIMVGIVALMVALLLIGYGAGVQAVLYAAVGVLVAAVIFWFAFGRCPMCRHSIHFGAVYCLHCGTRINWK